MNKFFLTLPILIYPTWLLAHGSNNDGFLHPITGLDHLLAMLAVGAWSALIGGKAIFIVPIAFVFTMILGAWMGFLQIMVPYSELGIAISIILLGMAIAFNERGNITVAATGVALFGIFHGFAHGTEIPFNANKFNYVLGFLMTTASLHVIGAFATLLTLKKTYGRELLKAVGFITLLLGINFVFLIELKT